VSDAGYVIERSPRLGSPTPRKAMRRFTVILEPEADGGFSAWVPDLPGCASQGETREEVMGNIREAIECHLAGLLADGLPVPAPRALVDAVDVKTAA
jgi:predicted RNase H-like HicB family nuclease